jgi:hypothetical protein
MIAEGRASIHQAWWVLVFPLIMLFLTVLSFNQLGEGPEGALRPGAAMSRFLSIRNLSSDRCEGPAAPAPTSRWRSNAARCAGWSARAAPASR